MFEYSLNGGAVKDTNLKANHNIASSILLASIAVKDTNLKANHNEDFTVYMNGNAVKDTNLKANHNQCLMMLCQPLLLKILI